MRRPTPTRQPASAGRFEFRELVSKSKSHHWPARRGFVRLPHAALRLRVPLRRTKPLRGGKDPGLVHKPSASATRPIDSDLAPCLYQRAAPCYSSACSRLAAASVRFFTSRSPGTLPRTRPLPIYSTYVKAKAVPVAASSSEIASARPTGPELRPHSFTALRIQHSSKRRTISALSYHPSTRMSGSSGDGFLFPSPYRRVSQGGHRLVSQVTPLLLGHPLPVIEGIITADRPWSRHTTDCMHTA